MTSFSYKIEVADENEYKNIVASIGEFTGLRTDRITIHGSYDKPPERWSIEDRFLKENTKKAVTRLGEKEYLMEFASSDPLLFLQILNTPAVNAGIIKRKEITNGQEFFKKINENASCSEVVIYGDHLIFPEKIGEADQEKLAYILDEINKPEGVFSRLESDYDEGLEERKKAFYCDIKKNYRKLRECEMTIEEKSEKKNPNALLLMPVISAGVGTVIWLGLYFLGLLNADPTSVIWDALLVGFGFSLTSICIHHAFTYYNFHINNREEYKRRTNSSDHAFSLFIVVYLIVVTALFSLFNTDSIVESVEVIASFSLLLSIAYGKLSQMEEFVYYRDTPPLRHHIYVFVPSGMATAGFLSAVRVDVFGLGVGMPLTFICILVSLAVAYIRHRMWKKKDSEMGEEYGLINEVVKDIINGEDSTYESSEEKKAIEKLLKGTGFIHQKEGPWKKGCLVVRPVEQGVSSPG